MGEMGERDHKELPHVIIEADKSQICRVGQHAGDMRRTDAAVQV